MMNAQYITDRIARRYTGATQDHAYTIPSVDAHWSGQPHPMQVLLDNSGQMRVYKDLARRCFYAERFFIDDVPTGCEVYVKVIDAEDGYIVEIHHAVESTTFWVKDRDTEPFTAAFDRGFPLTMIRDFILGFVYEGQHDDCQPAEWIGFTNRMIQEEQDREHYSDSDYDERYNYTLGSAATGITEQA